ncbi:MAG TPA: glycosyltransferase family 2 protein [Candidatus Saccharimonadales bacterium]|jgi:cellulose synthase/poly-beta-1,6-N-acetylglucosamine synthase-like glycosyltransferase|nr:glycosyltransferase family 2 protein [Candidatus Saccharimonadales bacterium]
MIWADLVTYFIVIVSVVNLLRMTLYLVGSDIYGVQRAAKKHKARRSWPYEPSVSIVVPAHNEAPVIEKTLECLTHIDYPAHKLQIVVADDGSTDDTVAIIKRYVQEHHDGHEIVVFEQPNGGKADALNNAMASTVTGQLVMCLDADSIIAKDGVRKAVAYFRDPRVMALASNVNILPNGTLLGLIQRFEYLISYHMKKAQTVFNIEYIIGGIGSMFRRNMLDIVQYYDTNTMTEDIDLTMKILAKGNKAHRVAYAADCLTYTEAVPTFKSLINQRFRWKYGRMQTFLKNASMFFSLRRKYAWRLTWIILPYAIVQEVLFLLEPFIVGYILFVSIYYHDPYAVLMAYGVITLYIWVNIWSTTHLSIRERLKLTAAAMVMYACLYALSVVEYVALLRSIKQLPRLSKSISGERTTWVSPERNAAVKQRATS